MCAASDRRQLQRFADTLAVHLVSGLRAESGDLLFDLAVVRFRIPHDSPRRVRHAVGGTAPFQRTQLQPLVCRGLTEFTRSFEDQIALFAVDEAGNPRPA